ncbi:MAG: hypothetical protein JO069_20995 [Verrucomicrobia bacterium]|nr:hypothetical protein [Verrucomicrobiota bacterium]
MCSACVAALLAAPVSAPAHGFAGNRFFPATLATDDPFVANEFSLPTFEAIRQPGEPPAKTFDFATDIALRLTPNFGIEAGDDYQLQKSPGSRLQTGFGNVDVGGKYQFFVSAEHETILSVGADAEIGGTGRQSIGADRFSTVTPALFFGKGFGDLPDSVSALRPLALTGVLGVSFPTRSSVRGGGAVERVSNQLEWGFALEYSLIYLQTQVKDVGLRAPFDRLIPLVEFSFETPLNRGRPPTTGTINPGVIWSGRYFQVGVEAVIPANAHTGNNVGVLAQLHFYLDDVFPKLFKKPLLANWP